jgi:CelD/BcsL family acetyltransferase involved in cellulose biosynthesis
MANLDAKIITKTQQFLSLKDEWNDLLDKCLSKSIFLTWDWMFAWWSEFGSDYKLQLVIVRGECGELIGIAPFCITNCSSNYPKDSLVFLGSAEVSSEFLDIISEPDCANEIASSIFNCLCGSDRHWNCIYLTDLLKSSLVYTTFRKIANNNNFVEKKGLSQECPYLPLPDTEELMMAMLKPHLRSTVKRKSKKIDKLGAKLIFSENVADLDSSLLSLFSLHQKCWNARGMKGNFRKEKIRSFHTRVAKYFILRNLLRLYFIEVDGVKIAALYAFYFKGKFFYYQSGYDPDWLSCSPGTVLMWKTIADAIFLNADEFDYLRGNEDYKSLWSTQLQKSYFLIFIPPGDMKLRLYFKLKDIKKYMKNKIKQHVKK